MLKNELIWFQKYDFTSYVLCLYVSKTDIGSL